MSPSLAPPPSPEIAQQASPQQAQSVFMSQGLDQPQQNPGMQAVEQIGTLVQGLDGWVGQMKTVVEQFDPTLMPFVQQIAESAVKLMQTAQQKAERSGIQRGSPVVPASQPVNPSAPPPAQPGPGA